MKKSAFSHQPSAISPLKRVPGFTVLFASLIAALLLAVGLAIFDIIFKEVSFATIVRDSNYASYAADTGAECAQYWDYKCQSAGLCTTSQSLFAISTASVLPSSGAYCDGEDIIAGKIVSTSAADPYGPWQFPATGNSLSNPSAYSATTTFTIDLVPNTGQLPKPPPYCVFVEVIKNVNPTNGHVSTVIISRGYNTCDQNNPNRIERAYKISY